MKLPCFTPRTSHCGRSPAVKSLLGHALAAKIDGSLFSAAPCARKGRRFSGWVLVVALLLPTFVAAADPPSAAWRRVQRVFDEVRARYPGRIDEEALANRAIQAMLQGLDSHSMLLDENANRAFRQDMQGTYVGLGVEVERERDGLTIRSAQEDTPAYQAGLRAGDRITALDGVVVNGLTLEQAMNLARGNPDTAVNLTVLRPGDIEPRIVTVKRTLVPRQTVRERRLDGDIGYLRVERFQQSTPQLVMKALRRLEASGAPELAGLIIDLRDNPGGSVRAAVAVSSAFLHEDALVVSMEGPSIGADSQLFTRAVEAGQKDAGGDVLAGPDFARSVPMVVLVDSGSASAAEILAGALQDHGRALLVGTRTYGKGSVQSVVSLGDGTALKLTVARYLTPSGRAIQGKGLEPDARIEARAGETGDDPAADCQLDEAVRLLAQAQTGRKPRLPVVKTNTVDAARAAPAVPSVNSPTATR